MIPKPSLDSFDGGENRFGRYETSFGAMVGHTGMRTGFEFATSQVTAELSGDQLTVVFDVTGTHPGTYTIQVERLGDEVIGTWTQGERSGQVSAILVTAHRHPWILCQKSQWKSLPHQSPLI